MTYDEYFDIYILTSESRDLSFDEWLCLMLDREKEKNKPISEKELDRLAFYEEKKKFKESNLPFQTKWVEGFKAGYRKAKEESCYPVSKNSNPIRNNSLK